ncbi:MAG: glycosyltransferase [Isosphaeraceae bacterium]|nr:glycosyltransferase [Isosphaeraceae bacterium]
MRILIAHSFYRIAGGEDRYVRQQVDLLGRSHDVHLEGRINAELDQGPATAAGMLYSPLERWAIARAFRAFGPDLVHLHNPYPSMGPAVHLAAAAAGLPLVQTVHNFRIRCPNGLLFTEGSPCDRCVGGRYDQAIRHACFPTRRQAAAYASALWTHRFVLKLDELVDLYIAPSRFVRRRLVKWGIPAERTTVVRNFTVIPEPPPPAGERGLYLGRLSAEKGLLTLLAALKLAGDPPFDIVGGGPQSEILRVRVDSLGLQNTRLLGPVDADRVPEVIAEARYAVIPSTWEENAPLAALEVMAAGRPVIASDIGGLPELVDVGRGRLVSPGNTMELAGAVATYAGDGATAIADGARARSFVVAECSAEAHLAGLELAYATAIEARRKRSAAAVVPVPALRTRVQAVDGWGVTAPTAPRRRPARPPLHVLMVHCYYRDLGGENLSFEAETALLRDAGVRVTTYTRDNRELDGAGFAGRALAGVRTAWAEDSYREVRAIARRSRPNVVHFQNTFPLISPSAHHAVHRLGLPVVQTLRNYRLVCSSGILFRDGRVCEDCVGRHLPLPAVVHRCYHDSVPASAAVSFMQVFHRALGTWADAVDVYVAPSEFARSTFVSAGIPADKIVVKPNFVDPDPGVAPVAGRYALYAGRLAPEKGVITLVDAWRNDGLPPLLVVGDGPLRRNLEARIVQHGIEGRVELLGHQPPERVMSLMREAFCAVFPSEWYETFGRVAAEAYACGVPVVASRRGAMAEIVKDGITGRLFAPGDSSDLANVVRNMASDPTTYGAMRHAARVVYEDTFSAERNLTQLLAIYDRACAGATGGSAGLVATATHGRVQ